MYLTIAIVLILLALAGWWLAKGQKHRPFTYQEVLEIKKRDFEKQPGTQDQAGSIRFWEHLSVWGQRRNASDGVVKVMLPPENISQLRLFEIQCFLFARTMHHIAPYTTQEGSRKIMDQLGRDLIQSSIVVLGLNQKEVCDAILLRKETYFSYLGREDASPLHTILANFVLQSEEEGRPTRKVPLPVIPQDSPEAAMRHGLVMILQSGFDDIAMDSMLDVLEGWMFRNKGMQAAFN